MRLSSGVTAIATSSDTAVDVITLAAIRASGGTFNNVRLVNEGGVAGFFSIDGGNAWERLPSDQVITTLYDLPAISNVKVKRIALGTDLTGLFASVWG